MRTLLAWLGRTGLLYLVLFLATAFYVLAWPAVSSQFSGESLRQDAMAIGEVRTQLATDRAQAEENLAARIETTKGAGRSALENRLREVRTERDAAQRERDAAGGFLSSIRPSRILAAKRLDLRIAALDAEIAGLEAALDAKRRETALVEARATLAQYPRFPTVNAIAASRRLCAQSQRELAQFDERPETERNLRDLVLRERERLIAERDRRCTAAERRTAERQRALQAREAAANASARLAEAREWSADPLPDPAAGISDTTLRDIAGRAALALLAILLLPFAIRTLFYYAFAPMVGRGPPIRLSIPSGIGAAPIPTGPSRPSLQLTLAEGEELLVRQSYLQSSQSGARMRTRWLLSARSPLTSLASGMAFLTEARGADAMFGISARDDPFAEIARIDLPASGAIVLQPRALAAIVQPATRPLQIRSRWKLFSLHAWLTFQFRYLVFHGPAALIVKGGRGVRIEAAESGRVFGQDQLLGFSAHVAYTVRRNETFQPYLFGREPLFRDRVADDSAEADGILVIEEAPMAGRRGGVRGGLEGAFDAVLKAFGI